jgi:hypothetical protein
MFARGNPLFRAVPSKYRDALQLDELDPNGRKQVAKPELPDDVFLKRAGFSRRDPNFCNVYMLHYFISFLPRKAIKFFSGMFGSVVC